MTDSDARSRRCGSTFLFVACPCGIGVDYASCCERFHDGAAAPTAIDLMRARYSAYVVRRADFLLSTWHPDTRPSEVTFNPAQRWQQLEVLESTDGTMFDDEGAVRFAASFSSPDGPRRLLEQSRFVRVDGRWVYLVATEAAVVDELFDD